MSADVNRVASKFGGAVETRGEKLKVKCPVCGHDSLWIEPGDKEPVIGWCDPCHSAGRQEQVTARVREAYGNGAAKKAPAPVQKTVKETPINPPWDKWVPLTEATYQIVKKARATRKSYMPGLDMLRRLGVREAPGKSDAPHAQIGFPHSLGDVLDAPAFVIETDPLKDWSECHIDNLKVLTDAWKTPGKKHWYQAGPKRQDVVFGLLSYQFAPPPALRFATGTPAFYPTTGEEAVVKGRKYILLAPETERGKALGPAVAAPPPPDYVSSFFMIDEIWLVEGQWDAACLIEHGYTAWAILAAGQEDLHPGLMAIVSQASRVYVIRDREKDGTYKTSFAKLMDKLPVVYTRFVELPEGIKDVCELRHRTTEESFRAILSKASQFSVEIKPRVEIEVEDTVADVGIPDMPEECLDGWLGEKCKEELTRDNELPIAYAWPALLTVASTMVPNTEGKTAVRTNLFTTLIGDIHSGKNESIERAGTLLGFNIEERGAVTPRSGEGLTNWLVRQTAPEGWDGEEDLPDPDKSKPAPRVLLFVDELAEFMGKSNIQGASLPWYLNSLYKYDSMVNDSSKESAKIYARLSFVSGIPLGDFGKAFKANSLGGLYDRFVFGHMPTGWIYTFQPYIRGEFEVPERVSVEIDHTVWDTTREWNKEAQANKIDLGRTVELALRAAVICASFSRKRRLTGNDLGPARAFVDYQRRVRQLLQPNSGETKEGELTIKLLRTIDTMPRGGWIKLNDLKKNTHAYDYGTMADKILVALAASGYIEEHAGFTHKFGWRIRKIYDETV